MPAGNRVALSATSITSGGMWNSINSTEPTAKQVLAEQAERLLKAKNGAASEHSSAHCEPAPEFRAFLVSSPLECPIMP